MTNLTIPGPHHRHVDFETGHIYHIDPISGAIIARKEMVLPKDHDAEYQAWASERRADEALPSDHATASEGLSKLNRQAPDSKDVEAEPIKRGRPKTKYANPVAACMPFLVIPDPLPWVDDIIHGSICTSAGTSNGKINVKTRAVVGALFLPEISAESCQTHEYTLRTAQRIAKAARHAAHGIASYIERRPLIKAELEAEVGSIALFRASQA